MKSYKTSRSPLKMLNTGISRQKLKDYNGLTPQIENTYQEYLGVKFGMNNKVRINMKICVEKLNIARPDISKGQENYGNL